MRYFGSPVRVRSLQVCGVAQWVEQKAFKLYAYCLSPLRNKEDAVDHRYFASYAKPNAD